LGLFNVHTISEKQLSFADLPDTLKDIARYWRELAADRRAPSWKEMDLVQTNPQILQTTTVVDCNSDGSYIYRFSGSGIREVHKVELTGKTTEAVPVPELTRHIKSALDRIYRSCMPEYATYVSKDGRGLSQTTTVARLPLSSDGKVVDKILMAIVYGKQTF